MTICRIRIEFWVFKASNTHTGYVTLIAFPLQQWLQESASMLRYGYIACLAVFCTTEQTENIARQNINCLVSKTE